MSPIRRKEPKPAVIVGADAFIELTQGLTAIVDAVDAPSIEVRNWCAVYTPTGGPYAATRGKKSKGERRTVYLHAFLMGRRAGFEIDHSDGDSLNNRRSNLRWATRAQNQFNIGPKASNPYGLKGINFDPRYGGRWRARIRVAGRQKFLGYFKTAEAAASAYSDAADLYHGEFARTE